MINRTMHPDTRYAAYANRVVSRNPGPAREESAMNINPGELKHRIQIIRRDRTADADGYEIPSRKRWCIPARLS